MEGKNNMPRNEDSRYFEWDEAIKDKYIRTGKQYMISNLFRNHLFGCINDTY